MTFEKIIKDIEKLIETSKVGFVSKNIAINDWLFIQNSIDYLPVLYSISSITYQEEYFTEQSDHLCDLSQVIFWDSKPVGILPLTLSSKDKELFLTSQGRPVVQPLVLDQIPRSSQKKIFSECANLVQTINKNYKIKEFCLQEIYSSKCHISTWYEHFLTKNFVPNNQFSLILNLEQTYEEIKRNYRKSYKSLINKGKKNWEVHIFQEDFMRWEEFQDLHEQVSGRRTRSKKTWKIQADNLKNKNAIFIYIVDNEEIMVGGAYFDLSKDEANYSVGVYRRDLVTQPLGHIIQDKAIQHFIMLGIKRYKIGNKPFPVLNQDLSDKDISIAEFKSGFGAEMYIEPQLIKSN